MTPSNPGWATGYTPTAAEWAQAFSSKTDYGAGPTQGLLGSLQAPSNGMLPIGNLGNYTPGYLGSGPGLTVDAGAGSLTIRFDGTTGSGAVVLQDSPSLITPDIGDAVASSLLMQAGQVVALPVAANDVANKSYVDQVAQGLDPKAACDYATVAPLPACTYNNGAAGVGATLTANANGALSVGGGSPTVGMRILVKDQVAGLQNGIYVVTATGSAGAPWVLTRSLDANSGTEISSAYTFIQLGTLQATGWTCITADPIVIGTTAIVFTQSSGAGTYTAGTGLSLVGTQFSLSNTAVSAGSYSLGSFTVNAQGQLIAASSTPSTGSGNVVLANSPTLTTPALGTPSAAVLTFATGLPLTTGVTGLLPVANGGSGAGTLTGYLKGNGTSAFTASNTIPAGDLSGTLGADHGGTGFASYAIGDMLYASGATTLAKLTAVAANNVLRSGGLLTAPAWGKLDLANDVTGITRTANGGTGLGGATPFTANGVMYASAAGVLATSAGLQFNGTGVGIGVVPASNVSLINGANIAGGVVSSGQLNYGTVQSGVTATAYYFRSLASTAAASFTNPQLIHFSADQATFGAGSTVSAQFGFYAASTLIGGTANYGFFGDIAAGTNRYNLFMNGTANNHINGSLGLGTTSLTSVRFYNALAITGSANSFGNLTQATVQSGVTASAYGYKTILGTAAASFTDALLIHYGAEQATIGAGSTVQTQIAYRAEATLIGASFNVGLQLENTAAVTSGKVAYGIVNNVNIATGGGTTWGYYGQGTAPNYFAGNVGIATQTFGTGAAGVLAFGNGTAPSTNITGGQLYVEAGALKFRGSSGTVTTVAPA